jgi:RNA polymerase sigma factor (sigma-70 family)
LRVLRCQVTRVRQTLIASYFKLAVAVARAFASRPQDIDDLVGQACVTLIRAVDLFDVDRGVRFSTYATRAIRTELSRFIIRRRKRAMRCVDPLLLWRHPDRHGRGGNGAAGILAILEPMLERLDPREASILRSRFGLNEIPGNTTLQAVADGLGISRERVRQLESGALRKLRRMLEESPLAETLLERIDRSPALPQGAVHPPVSTRDRREPLAK